MTDEEETDEATPPKIRVIHDEDAESPRTWDNLGTMACWHRRYNLGDVQPKQDPREWLRENAPKGSVVLPLYLYDHSGITMSTGAFSCPWDSGQVGWIICTPEQIREEYKKKRISKKMRADVERVLKEEVSTYDDYLTGNAWGFDIEGGDSCWGFIGDSALEAMKEHVPDELHVELVQAWANRQ